MKEVSLKFSMSTLALSFINNTPGSRRARSKTVGTGWPTAAPNLSRLGLRHRWPRSLSVSQTDAFLLGRRGWRAVSVLPFLGRCAISACTSPPWPVEKSCHSLASLWHSYWLDHDPLRSAPLIILSQISFHGKINIHIIAMSMCAILLKNAFEGPTQSGVTLGIILDYLECDCETSKRHSCRRASFIKGKLHYAPTTMSCFQHSTSIN